MKKKYNRIYAYIVPLFLSNCTFFIFEGFWTENWFMVFWAFCIGIALIGLYTRKNPKETRMMTCVNWIAPFLMCGCAIMDVIGLSKNIPSLSHNAFFIGGAIVIIYIILFIINIVLTKKKQTNSN